MVSDNAWAIVYSSKEFATFAQQWDFETTDKTTALLQQVGKRLKHLRRGRRIARMKPLVKGQETWER